MRNWIGLSALALALLTVAVSETMAQCPTVNEYSPTIIGRTINPASTYFSLKGDIADGNYFAIDTTGANMVFEFDTNNSTSVPGAIPVTIPAPPGNRDAARLALLAAINAQPSCPCTASCLYAADSGLLEYLTLIWKSEAGYGRTNTASGTNLTARNFAHYGAAASHILLTGANLYSLTAVKLQNTVTSQILTGTRDYRPADGLHVGYLFRVAPDLGDPTAAPPAGTYNLIVEKTGCTTVTIPAAVRVVDNLLDDSTFSMNMIGNTNENGCGGSGSYDVWPGPLWKHNGVSGMPVSTFEYREKASLYSVNCQRQDPYPMNDWIWGSLTSDRKGLHQVWQEIPVSFSAPTIVTLTGMYSGGTSALMNYGARLYDQNGSLIAENANSDSDWINNTPPNSTWANFELSGTFPAGTTTIKAVFYLDILTDYVGAAVNFDDLLLFVGQVCPNPPSVTSISPTYGVRGTSQTVTITGTNFAAGSTTVKLYQDTTELSPTSMSVNSDTQMTATFNLTGVARDYWGVAVRRTGCTVATLPDVFDVVLAGPTLTNGSFELPTVAANACFADTSIAGIPEDWTSIHIDPYGGGSHFRDALYTTKFMPTCPSPDGDHWASVEAPDSSYAGKRRLTQTVTATPGTTYSLSGYFAAGGPNKLQLSLLDGGYHAGAISGASTTVLPGPGNYNWTLGYVMGAPSGNLITAVWDTDNDAQGAKIGHADKLVLQECTTPVTVTAFSPAVAGSGSILTEAIVTGSGFSNGSPTVYLVRPGATAVGTNVMILDDGHLQCNFDLAQAGLGPMDVIVSNNGCFATLDDGVFTAPSAGLINGEFELPEAPQVCGTPVATLPTGWSFSTPAQSTRDGDYDIPTCPRLNPAGDHYMSLSTGDGNDMSAWQTIYVTPSRVYQFGGWFAGGGTNSVTLKLVDGASPTGTVLASRTFNPSGPYDWMAKSVQGTAASSLMTVVWEMTGPVGQSVSHADGLYVDTRCNLPFADTDGDGDVDQFDFAVFQSCYTGPGAEAVPQEPVYCACLNVDGPSGSPDTDIDQGDLALFEACASGPGIPAAPGCLTH
jgi:hypothetical protein